MVQIVLKWIRVVYKRTITSIAFAPALIALSFLIISFLMVMFDFSETGKNIKSNITWLHLKDANTARNIISVVAAGIISLTVFSFSMVMILLNQAASQMSNRILDKLIENKFQQIVLGFYIGTIVYALFLLSTIRDIDSGIYIPSISTYLLIAFTIVDIFLFIYFLHYITQSVKYETIVHKIYENTRKAMLKSCMLCEDNNHQLLPEIEGRKISAYKSGIFQGFQKEELLAICKKEDIRISFLYPIGTFLIEGTPILTIMGNKQPTEGFEKDLELIINIHRGQEVDIHYYYGFRQLMEIAIKALSQGINDPGTAVLSLHALGDLLSIRIKNFPQLYLKDKDKVVRIITKEMSFKEILEDCILPIWDYGKNDRMIQKEFLHILSQLKTTSSKEVIENLIQLVTSATGSDKRINI